jgi:hypothetical protein
MAIALLSRTPALSNWLRNFLAFAILFLCPSNVFAQSPKLEAISLGAFAVNQSGAATYSIPIITPPSFGPNPKLSLVYNNQKQNGLVGVGWSLEGLPAIHKCARTVAQDGVRSGFGAWCLDNQRLMLTSGTGGSGSEYRTELDTFVKISYLDLTTSCGFGCTPPCGRSFNLLNKGGDKLIFKPFNCGNNNFMWPLVQLTDTSGNFMKVTYEFGTGNLASDPDVGVFRPLRIEYGGNLDLTTGNINFTPQRAVQFFYEDRPDKTSTFVPGDPFAQMKMAKRLTKI